MRSLARATVLGAAAGRVAVGVGILAATRPALRALGFSGSDPAVETLARLAGGRDVALGALAFACRDDTVALRRVAAVSAAVDAGDALAFAAVGGRPELRRAALAGSTAGSLAALGGAWAAHRLGR